MHDLPVGCKLERGRRLRIHQSLRIWSLVAVLLSTSGCASTLTSQVFSAIENTYVEKPDFSKLRREAFIGLSKRLPPETFGVKEVNGDLVLDYQVPGSPLLSKTFAARADRAEATRDVDFGFELARRIASNVPKEKLEMAMLRRAVESLDTMSAFIHWTEISGLPSSESSDNGDVGLGVPVRSSPSIVVDPIDGSPAQRAGILPGDRLLAIDGVPTGDLESSEAATKLRGNLGTEVRVTIRREGWVEDKSFSLVREARASAVEAQSLGDGIGLIVLKHFQFLAGQDFEVALRRMEAEGIRDLIVDLRHNSEGLFYQAIAMAGKFLPPRTVVIHLRTRVLAQPQEYFTYGEKVRKSLPLLLIVDKETAGSAEAFAAAIQESQRGLLLGERTYGRSVFISYLTVTGGLGLILPTGKWFTGRNLDLEGKGLTPDILMADDQRSSRPTQGDLSQDVYLRRAVEIIKERRAKP
jgi:carboxyl-terminal processing protease